MNLHEYEHEVALPNLGNVLIGFDVKETGLIADGELFEHPVFRLRGVWPANPDGSYNDNATPNLTPDDDGAVNAAMYTYAAKHGYDDKRFYSHC